jgi:hypothetical protein
MCYEQVVNFIHLPFEIRKWKECACPHQFTKRGTSLVLPLCIEVPVPSQSSKRSCICLLVVSIVPLSIILIFDFGIVPTVCYLLFFDFFTLTNQ